VKEVRELGSEGSEELGSDELGSEGSEGSDEVILQLYEIQLKKYN